MCISLKLLRRKVKKLSDSLHLITKYLSEHMEGSSSEINEQLVLFSLRRCEANITEVNESFLNELQIMTKGAYKIDEIGSSVYYFKIGNTAIQLQVIIDERIDIHPYIIYDEQLIKEEIEKVLELDQILYNVLRTKGLQK